MDACLTLAELDAAVDAADPGHRAHLDTCSRCRSAVEDLRRDQDLLGELRDAAAAPAPAWDSTARLDTALPANAIDGYLLETEVHRGANGAVYRGASQQGEAVALKMLRDGPLTSTRTRWRFDREIELASRLHHPAIVTPVDHGTADRCRWYAMPWIEGRHLDAHVATAKLSQRATVELLLQVCRAVAHAHSRGVIHRDLKPSNILVDAGGKPHILDFGIALGPGAGGGGAASVTQTGYFVGTLAYAAPEQVRDQRDAVCAATDVYALGVILHELLTGTLPYPVSDDLAATVQSITSVEPKGVQGRLDCALGAIVMVSLEKDPATRYQSAGTLAADVERYLRGEAIRAPGLPRWYLARKALRRNARVLAVTAVIVGATLATLGTVLSYHLAAENQRTTARNIQEVLRDILSAAEPSRMGGDVPLLEVLEKAAQQIEETLGTAPDVQGAVQFTIGETYRRLLIDDRAMRHLEAALARYREVDAEPHLEVARTLHALGMVSIRRSDRRGVEYQREAFDIRRRALGEQHPLVAESRRALAFALLRGPDAEPPLEDVDAMLSAALQSFQGDGTTEAQAARTWHRIALLHAAQGRRAEAAASFGRAVDMLTEDGSHPAWTIECHNDYASFLVASGDLESARQQLDHSNRIVTAAFGAARTTDLLRRFARLHFARKEWLASEELSLRALRHELRTLCSRRPGADPAVDDLLARLGRAPGDPAHAEAVVAAFAKLREFRGNGAFEVARWINEFAELMRALERPTLAVSLLRESIRFRCRVYGAQCPHRGAALERLAQLLVSQGGQAEALSLLREAEQIATAQENAPARGRIARLAATLEHSTARER